MPMREDYQISFGQRLRQFRTHKGISQENLAALSGLDRTYIGGIERGERNPTLKNIVKIAAALQISPSELFNGPAS